METRVEMDRFLPREEISMTYARFADHRPTHTTRVTLLRLAAILCLTGAGWCRAAAAPAPPPPRGAPAAAPVAASQAAAAGPGAPTDNPYVWKPRTKSVAVFKNGFGFFMAEGETTLRDGWCSAAEVPPATFGTLAVYSHDAGQSVDVVGAGPGEIVEFDGRDAPADLQTKLDRLAAARHLKVALTYDKAGAERTAAGKLVSVGPEYVVLEGDGNNFAVPVAAVRKMQTLDLPVRVHLAADGPRPPERASLGLAYLRQGVTWIPAYTLRVLDDETAELTLRGTFVNEAEDVVHADVSFVVGVPHFLHTNFLEPIAVGQVIRTIGAAVAPREVQSQIMSRAAIANNTITQNQFDGAGPGVVDRPVALAGGNAVAAAGNLPQLDGPAAATSPSTPRRTSRSAAARRRSSRCS
jgi:hypothetical protein